MAGLPVHRRSFGAMVDKAVGGYRIMAFISAFQAEDGSSILPTRSEIKNKPHEACFLLH